MALRRYICNVIPIAPHKARASRQAAYPINTYVHTDASLPTNKATGQHAGQHVYTDASLQRHKAAGLGVLWLDKDTETQTAMGVRIREHRDINRAELGAIYLALLLSQPLEGVTVFSDSQTSLSMIQRVRQGGWHHKYGLLAACVAYLVMCRQAPTRFVKVKGHSLATLSGGLWRPPWLCGSGG